jgi:two-component system, chemotaxis family, protein-glutamate methylesterase/glutaminase
LALARILSALPATFSLPVAVVQHVDPNHQSLVADILARRTHLRVKEASSGDLLMPGAVYVAPPGQHMLIGAGLRVQLSRTDPVHFLRPSADHLFESAAKFCGPVIGVILTGTGTDGAAGVTAIKAAGGTVIAQDEASSEFFGMPHAAIGTGVVDFVLPLDSIGPKLVTLTQRAE